MSGLTPFSGGGGIRQSRPVVSLQDRPLRRVRDYRFLYQKNRRYIVPTWKSQNLVRDDVLTKNKFGLLKHIQNEEFENFASDAYNSERGYSIRNNPDTGEVEMFIAGSRKARDWLANGWEYFDGAHGYRDSYAADMSQIARENHVTVIYGHSRGYAIADSMNVPGAVKVGLDGARIIKRDNKSWNVAQFNPVDQFLDGNISPDPDHWIENARAWQRNNWEYFHERPRVKKRKHEIHFLYKDRGYY